MTAFSYERFEVHTLPASEHVPFGFWEGRVRERIHPELSAVFVLPDRKEAARFTAEKILEIVERKPDAAITWPSGNQGNNVIDEVVRLSRERGISFKDTHAFHLDEYYPIDPEAPESFRKNLRERLIGPMGIPEDHFHQIQANPGSDGDKIAADYERELLTYDMDVVLHPIGPGGHVGFNEKGAALDSVTHVEPLSEETVHRDRVKRHLNSPDHAITQGIASVLRAKKIFFIDFDPAYAPYMTEALFGEIGPQNPSSWLRKAGSKVEAVVTADVAASFPSASPRPARTSP